MNTTERTYTRDEVARAVNDGANLVGYSDLINLIVNAQLTLLDTPDATLDDVILACWQVEDDDYEAAGVSMDLELSEAEERAVDAALIERVKGWSS